MTIAKRETVSAIPLDAMVLVRIQVIGYVREIDQNGPIRCQVSGSQLRKLTAKYPGQIEILSMTTASTNIGANVPGSPAIQAHQRRVNQSLVREAVSASEKEKVKPPVKAPSGTTGSPAVTKENTAKHSTAQTAIPGRSTVKVAAKSDSATLVDDTVEIPTA